MAEMSSEVVAPSCVRFCPSDRELKCQDCQHQIKSILMIDPFRRLLENESKCIACDQDVSLLRTCIYEPEVYHGGSRDCPIRGILDGKPVHPRASHGMFWVETGEPWEKVSNTTLTET